jgi:D-glycerate 3-kinase
VWNAILVPNSRLQIRLRATLEGVTAHDWIDGFLQAERLPPAYRALVERLHVPLAARVAAAARAKGSLYVLGICGTQASGKSTLSASLAHLLQAQGLSVAVLSLDDLYMTHAARQALGQRVHPLLATRGVPGTHDIDLGLRVFDALAAGRAVELPAFDKAQDDRRPPGSGRHAPAGTQVLVFEGWCVGAKPQAEQALREPVNALEREQDADGRWRRHANEALAGDYQRLFARLDELWLLQAPGFEAVLEWRIGQEHKLRERLAATGVQGTRVMSDAEVERFIAHYERLTRHILAEMPARADVVIPVERAG